jgi:DNA-binding transcriptional LysR family regulator
MEFPMQWTDRIGRRLKLRDLHILMAVAQSGSMVKAAQHLAVSQPVVSKAIADLEQTVGVRLLDRGPHGVEPTLYGRALIDSGVAAFDDLRQGVQRIEFLADPAAGEIRIGCGEVWVAGLLPAIIERLRKKYPRIVCHVDQATTASDPGFPELRERRVDLVLGQIPDPCQEDDVSIDVLFYERTFVVAGKRSKWARRRKIDLAELVDEPWLMVPPNSLSFARIRDVFAAKELKMPQPSVVSFSVHLRNSLLPTGRYLAYLPESFMHFGAMRSSFKVLPVDFPVTPRPVGIVTLKNRTLNPAAQLFISCAREVVKPLAKERIDR